MMKIKGTLIVSSDLHEEAIMLKAMANNKHGFDLNVVKSDDLPARTMRIIKHELGDTLNPVYEMLDTDTFKPPINLILREWKIVMVGRND